MAAHYRIHDEPEPGALSHLVADPRWPLLAVMLAGTWLSWPWFIFNAIAIGSPTRKKEIALALGGFAGTLIIAIIVVALARREIIVTDTAVRLVLLAIVVWKLGVSYAMYRLQNRTFHIYEYYEGAVRNRAWMLAVGAMFLRPHVLDLSDNPLWWIVVGGGLR